MFALINKTWIYNHITRQQDLLFYKYLFHIRVILFFITFTTFTLCLYPTLVLLYAPRFVTLIISKRAHSRAIQERDGESKFLLLFGSGDRLLTERGSDPFEIEIAGSALSSSRPPEQVVTPGQQQQRQQPNRAMYYHYTPVECLQEWRTCRQLSYPMPPGLSKWSRRVGDVDETQRTDNVPSAFTISRSSCDPIIQMSENVKMIDLTYFTVSLVFYDLKKE